MARRINGKLEFGAVLFVLALGATGTSLAHHRKRTRLTSPDPERAIPAAWPF
jgi:hypothetical protein